MMVILGLQLTKLIGVWGFMELSRFCGFMRPKRPYNFWTILDKSCFADSKGKLFAGTTFGLGYIV